MAAIRGESPFVVPTLEKRVHREPNVTKHSVKPPHSGLTSIVACQRPSKSPFDGIY